MYAVKPTFGAHHNYKVVPFLALAIIACLNTFLHLRLLLSSFRAFSVCLIGLRTIKIIKKIAKFPFFVWLLLLLNVDDVKSLYFRGRKKRIVEFLCENSIQTIFKRTICALQWQSENECDKKKKKTMEIQSNKENE